MGPTEVISSSFSLPYTTIPRSTPSPLNTCARGSIRYSSYTPSRILFGFAGFVSGPKILNTVLNPNSFLIAPTYFIEVWYFWAKKKQKPVSLKSFTACSGSKLIFAPRASRQSAVPDEDDAARLPCFATLTPAAATTNAVVVDMLKLPALSPPVPTISRVSISPVSTGIACSLIAAAHPLISSMVSALALLVDNAARNAAF